MSSEMAFLDLAPGDPLSQDGSLRPFSYSQFSECPAAPLNTAETECLPSQFHSSPSLATSSLLESEDHKSMLNGSPAGEPLSSLPCSPRKFDAFAEDVKGSAECGDHLSWTYSDSLPFGPSQGCIANIGPLQTNKEVLRPSTSNALDYDHFRGVPTVEDAENGSPTSTDNKCMLNDGLIGEPLSSLLCSSRKSHAFADDAKGRAECEGHLLQTYSDSLSFSPNLYCLANIGLPLEASQKILKPSTSNALDPDHFRGQPIIADPENGSPTTSKYKILAAVDDDNDADILRKKHVLDDSPAGEPLSSLLWSPRRSNAFAEDVKGNTECGEHLLQTYSDSLSFSPDLNCLANIGLPLEANREILKPSTSYALDADHFRGKPIVIDPENGSSTATEHKTLVAVDDVDADFMQRWHSRRKLGLSSDTDSRKKLKPTPDKSLELGTLHSGQLQSQLVNIPLSDDNENLNVLHYGHERTCEDTMCPGSGSETTEEDVTICSRSDSKTTEEGGRVDGEIDDSCDSKILQRKLNYSGVRDIVSFFQPVVARNESNAEEVCVLKPEHAEKKWIYPRKSRLGGRQRTMDAWIK